MKNITPKLQSPKNKFFLYARKSTEGDERQIQSLDDQVQVMKRKAQVIGIDIIEIFQESMSAKAPGRYKFNEMITRIQNGEAEGIIAWKLDRLSRNPIDSGTIQYMLQNGTLEQVITNDREYNPEDAGLLMSVENGMSNQFIMDLKKNVLRGMNSKTEKGIFCGQVPEGYLNNRLEKTIETDEQNFPLIQKLWKLMLTGTYTVPQLLLIANNSWGYTTNKKKKNKQLTESGLYGIFKNPFYTGNFLWKGEIKKGIHEAMITWDEYERVQKLIGNKGKTVRAQKHEFSYSGFIKCGECSGSIVGERRTKYIKATNLIKEFNYYRCSKRIADCNCKQKSINLEDLESQIYEILESIEIIPEFKEWGIKALKSEFDTIKEEKETIFNNLENKIHSSYKQLDKLLDFLMDETISSEKYKEKKEIIETNLRIYEEKRDKLLSNHDTSITETEELFDFIVGIRERFNNGNFRAKKLIFSQLGRNFTLKDGILAMDLNPWLLPFVKMLPLIQEEYNRFGPIKNGSSKGILKPNSSLISLWSGGPGLNWHTQGLKP